MIFLFQTYISTDYEKINWYDYFAPYLLRNWMKLALLLFFLKNSAYWEGARSYFCDFLVKEHVESYFSKWLFSITVHFCWISVYLSKYINKLNCLQKYYIFLFELHKCSFLLFLTISSSQKFDSQNKRVLKNFSFYKLLSGKQRFTYININIRKGIHIILHIHLRVWFNIWFGK